MIEKEHPTRIRYKEMFDKVLETLINGNAVKFVNEKEQLGNNKLLFHFYKSEQVISELKEILDFRYYVVYKKTIVDIRDLYDNFVNQDWCVKSRKIWNDAGLPPIIIERYISSKMINGEVISYLDNPNKIVETMVYKEIKTAFPWRTFQLKGEPELVHIKQIREEEYMIIYEDAYDLQTGKSEIFFSKKELELKFDIEL